MATKPPTRWIWMNTDDHSPWVCWLSHGCFSERLNSRLLLIVLGQIQSLLKIAVRLQPWSFHGQGHPKNEAFHSHAVPPNGWFISWKIPWKMADLGVPLLSGNHQMNQPAFYAGSLGVSSFLRIGCSRYPWKKWLILPSMVWYGIVIIHN